MVRLSTIALAASLGWGTKERRQARTGIPVLGVFRRLRGNGCKGPDVVQSDHEEKEDTREDGASHGAAGSGAHAATKHQRREGNGRANGVGGQKQPQQPLECS